MNVCKKLRDCEAGVAVRLIDETVVMMINDDPYVEVSKSSEESLNLRVIRSNQMKEVMNDQDGDQCEHCLSKASEYSEHSPDSRIEKTVTQGQHRQKIQDVS